jgi:predicted nucleic acid-binding protein
LNAYLDTSVLLPTLIVEPTTEVVYEFLGDDSRELLVSDFAAAEVASALSRLVRIALLTEADASARLTDFDAWRAAMSLPVDIQASDARLAYVYVRRFNLRLRAPDALHLAISRRLDVALVTLDRRMAAAARELGIVVERPTACSAEHMK